MFAALLLITGVVGNATSLREGIRYLLQMWAWDPLALEPLDPDGPFGLCFELVGLTNAERRDVILASLRDLGLDPVLIPLPDDPLANLLVMFDGQGPCTLFSAHYDKSRETPDYYGASDNTAAVCALLAAASELARMSPPTQVGFLFTTAEERGSLGARIFLHWARAQRMEIGEIVCFDMIGRGRLATRPSALPGFYFWLPGLGEMVYDGRSLLRGQPYVQPDALLVSRLRSVLGDDLVIYRHFTSHGDADVFQEAGLPSVSVSSDDMYCLDLVWERDADRIELLDQRNLSLAQQLVLGYTLRTP